MEFTQNLTSIRGGYIGMNNFLHVEGSKILVEMCWRSPCANYLGNSEGKIDMAAIQLVSNG